MWQHPEVLRHRGLNLLQILSRVLVLDLSTHIRVEGEVRGKVLKVFCVVSGVWGGVWVVCVGWVIHDQLNLTNHVHKKGAL